MGGVVSSIFGGGQQTPEIPVSNPITPPGIPESIDPVSKAVRETEQKRLKARRAFAGTLLTGKSSEDSNKKTSLL